VLKYINRKRVPHLFIGSGATVFTDPEHLSVDDEMDTALRIEGEIYAKYILSVKPDAKIAILSLNDDDGRDGAFRWSALRAVQRCARSD
jgi:branched-chain amino acid transport system substrate-binding protein